MSDAIGRLVRAGFIAKPRRKPGRKTVRLRLTSAGAELREAIQAKLAMPRGMDEVQVDRMIALTGNADTALKPIREDQIAYDD